MNQHKIEEYFKFRKQVNFHDDNEVESIAIESDRFYEKCLSNACKDEKCSSEKLMQRTKINELSRKCEQTEEAIASVNSIIEDKNEEIRKLQKMLDMSTITPLEYSTFDRSTTLNNTPDITSILNLPESSNKQSKSVESELSFSKFAGKFIDSELAELRSVGPTIRDDSTFVSCVIRYLYSGCLESLENKSVSGRGRTKEERKEKLTPEKKAVIDDIFAERINHLTNSTEEYKSRYKLLHKYIKDAIFNINRSERSKTSQACRNLAEIMNE